MIIDADIHYSVSIFFIPYILLEVPSNVILKKFKRPSTYLGILVVSWGITMTLTGLCKDFGGLMACRVVLAVCEAGFFPGAVCTCFECAQRSVFSMIFVTE